MNTQQLPAANHLSHQVPEKQMFLPINSMLQPITAAHTMPTPTTNWSMELMPWKITKSDHSGNVMEFTAHASQKDNEMRRALLHQKRKSEFSAMERLPIKQFISEEKITAHFNGLHISSDYIQHNGGGITDGTSDEYLSGMGKCCSNLTYKDYQVTTKELEKKLRNANRVTLCEELKRFNEEQKKVSYLPEALLNRMHKPCTALVLWQPPPHITNILSHTNIRDDNKNLTHQQKHQQNECDRIDDYIDVDSPHEQQEDISDFLDNNNTCNLDFNNIKTDSMDEDL